MRILIVNPEHPPIGGGAGNASANLAKRLLDLGDEVTILTCSYKKYPKSIVEDGVQIRRVFSIRKELSRSSPLEQVSFLIGSILEGVPLINKWRPDAIISFFGVPSGPLGWLGKKIFGIPYFVSLRGGDVPGFRSYDFGTLHKLASPIIRGLWKHADAVVANSEGLRGLANNFAPEIKCHIITNGVDTEFFQVKDNFKDGHNIIFAGRLVHQKGLDIVIKALGALSDHEWTFTIIGDGPIREDLSKLVRSLKLEKQIRFLGWKTRQEIKEFYKEADIFVFPSRDEGMSNAVLEAMSSGLTVIASEIPGNQAVIEDQITGYLVPVDAVELWKGRLEFILTTRGISEEIGLAANRHVDDKFSWSRVAREYRELILNSNIDQ